VLALGLGTLVTACVAPTAPAGGRPAGAAADAPAAEVGAFVQLANRARADAGCRTALAWHADVARVAQAHSADMLRRDYFDHVDSQGRTPMQRVQAAAIPVRAVAENIAQGQPTAAIVLQSWLDSPGHRRNLLNCEYTHHGVGLAGTYWTHVLVALR